MLRASLSPIFRSTKQL